METATIAILISAGSLVFLIGKEVLGGSWKLSSKLAEMEKGLRQAINDSKEEIEERQERQGRDFGETVSALKEKVREVELYVRDTYIEKDDFLVQMQHHNLMMTNNFANVTARLDRMEKKLDTKS